MANFLLIHGGSHGAWCWDACVAELSRRGHKAIALDLPGHGADATPRNAVNVSSYVSAVVSALDSEPDGSFTLVGHSLAGTVIPRVAVERSERVQELVFLAALVLSPGESVIDYIPEDRRPAYFEMAELSDDNSFLVDRDVAGKVFFNDLSPEDADAAYARLTPQALGVYLEESTVDISTLEHAKRYIVCRDDLALGYESCKAFARKLGGRVDEVAAGHDVMLSQPKLLVDLLVS